jgi:hypothetical protein
MVDEGVTLGHGQGILRLHDPVRHESGTSVTVTIAVETLRASMITHLSEWSPGLVDFMATLAADWRGWAGVREWVGDDILLRCRHDRVGHVVIGVELRYPQPLQWTAPGWAVTANIVVDPGSLEAVASGLRALLESAEGGTG